jgi:hypothetical protein
MAQKLTVASNHEALAAIFNDVEEVLYSPSEFASTNTKEIKDLIDLPVLGDSISFNMGEVELTQIKLTNETIWSSKAKRGDADITFNVASVSETVNNLLMTSANKKASIEMDALGTGAMHGNGYSLQPKALTGSLIFPSQDRKCVLILPNIEAYASLNVADGDNPAYFSLKVTPKENSEGVEIFIFEKNVKEPTKPEEEGEQTGA